MTVDGGARAARERLVGTVLTLPGAVLAELLGEPWDVVWIDLEHGALGPHDAQELILGAQAAGTSAFVRVPRSGWQSLLAPVLDAGADGIVAADVRSEEQADRIAIALRHRPDGERGYGPRRAGLRARTRTRRGTSVAARPELWVQIESQAGAAAAPEIARVRGVSALVLGIADFTYDIGAPLDLHAQALHEAIGVVRNAAHGAGVRFGLAGPLGNTPSALLALAEDADMLIESTDARLCAAAVDAAAARVRAIPGRQTRIAVAQLDA